jgi:predicted TIM-barrel enzyme
MDGRPQLLTGQHQSAPFLHHLHDCGNLHSSNRPALDSFFFFFLIEGQLRQQSQQTGMAYMGYSGGLVSTRVVGQQPNVYSLVTT